MNSLPIREAGRSKVRALPARASAVSARVGIVGPSWTWDRSSHARAVAEAAGGARHRERGCSAEVGAVAAS